MNLSFFEHDCFDSELFTTEAQRHGEKKAEGRRQESYWVLLIIFCFSLCLCGESNSPNPPLAENTHANVARLAPQYPGGRSTLPGSRALCAHQSQWARGTTGDAE